METNAYIIINTKDGEICLPRVVSDVSMPKISSSKSGVGRCLVGLLCAIVSILISFFSYALVVLQYSSVLPEAYREIANEYVKILQESGISFAISLKNYEYFIVFGVAMLLGILCFAFGLSSVVGYVLKHRKENRPVLSLILGLVCMLIYIVCVVYLSKAVSLFGLATGLFTA